MKHAGDAALDELAGLLESIRHLDSLREKKRGVFYRKSAAFLHFHEDPAGLFADMHGDHDWERFPVNTAAEQRALLARVESLVSMPPRREV